MTLLAASQRQDLDFLRDSLVQLETLAGRAHRQTFTELRERLDGWAARVAVIGRGGVGKTRLLNALLRMPGFLPTDTDPMCAAVTDLRINIPTDPTSGGVFEMFSDDDFAGFAAGDASSLNEALPICDADRLAADAADLRRRAEALAGDEIDQLLGTDHVFDIVTPEVTRAYLGGPSDAPSAGLTKRARLSLSRPRIMVPLVLTDTPGLASGTHLRDWAAVESLVAAEAYILVVSADEPVSEVDIALLQALVQMGRRDVIVFVNGIDRLDDCVHEVPQLLDIVAGRLVRAVPEIRPRLIAGSARLAELALRGDEQAKAEREALDEAQWTAYVAAQILPEAGPGLDPDQELVCRASGMRGLYDALSDMIDAGESGAALAEIKSDIRAELEHVLYLNRRDHEALTTRISFVNADVAALAVEDLQQDIDVLIDLQNALSEQLESAEEQTEKVVGKAWARLENRLATSIESFVEDRREEFRSFADDGGKASRTVQYDLTPMRQSMDDEIARAWKTSRSGSDVVLNNCLTACRMLLKDSPHGDSGEVTLEGLPHDRFDASLPLARTSLEVSVATKGAWAFWRPQGFNVEAAFTVLRGKVAAELRPAVDKVLKTFNKAQTERVSAGTDRIRVMLRVAEVALSSRVHDLKREMIDYEQVANDADFRRTVIQSVQSQIEVVERRLINLSAIDSALARAVTAQAA